MKNQKKTKSLNPIIKKLARFDKQVSGHAAKADELEQDIARMQEKLAAHNAAMEDIFIQRTAYTNKMCEAHQAYGFKTPLEMQFALNTVDIC